MATLYPAAPSGPAPIAVSAITGFLGSGKTTLLGRLLRHPAMAQTAVIINELGEIPLDHHLVRAIEGETVVMDSGCICCTVRGELVHTLRDLHLRRVRGDVPDFRRVVIETTGLADPAPILHTLIADPVLQAYYRLDGVIATVDAVHGDRQLDTHAESVKQAAVADRLVLTKTDLADTATVAALSRRLARLNPGALLIAAVQGAADPARLFDAGLYDPATKTADVRNWLRAEAYAAQNQADSCHDYDHDHTHHGHTHHGGDSRRHDDRIRAHCLTLDEPVEWDRFALWLGAIAREHGDNLLRVKGILNVAGEEQPVAVHGVQHLFHPPARLPAWPDSDRRSRLVVIARDIDRPTVEGWLAEYRAAPKRPAAAQNL
ncbi:MAG: GTP-binding protein [Rhodospirillales bacterium]|nr:GTP-binding protein [Rhodospirillales bacterium]